MLQNKLNNKCGLQISSCGFSHSKIGYNFAYFVDSMVNYEWFLFYNNINWYINKKLTHDPPLFGHNPFIVWPCVFGFVSGFVFQLMPETVHQNPAEQPIIYLTWGKLLRHHFILNCMKSGCASIFNLDPNSTWYWFIIVFSSNYPEERHYRLFEVINFIEIWNCQNVFGLSVTLMISWIN